MKILITGGLGLIGSNLAKHLSRYDHEIILVDSLIPDYGGNLYNVESFASENNIAINISDLRDKHSLHYLLEGVEVIYNLAAQTSHSGSMIHPYEDLDINSKAQLSLLSIVKEVCPKAIVVYTSTRQVYGKPQYLPVDEKHPIRPVDINGVNKLSGEYFHLLFHDLYGISTVVLRLTNIFGPGMRIKDARQTFLGIWINHLLNNKEILVYGDGTQIRDFNYVDDVTSALIAAANCTDCYGNIYNISGNEHLSLQCLAENLIELKGSGSWRLVPFPEDRKNIDIGNYYGDSTLFKRITSWNPNTDLKTGLKNTLDYYQHNIHHYL